MYCSTRCTAVPDVLQYQMYCSTCSTRCTAVPDVLQYQMYCSTRCTAVSDVLQYQMYCSTRCTAVPDAHSGCDNISALCRMLACVPASSCLVLLSLTLTQSHAINYKVSNLCTVAHPSWTSETGSFSPVIRHSRDIITP